MRSLSLQYPILGKLLKHLRGAGLNILLVVIAGVLTSFLFLPHEWWWMGLFSLLPLFIALRRVTAMRAAGWLMLLFGLVYFGCALTWLQVIFGMRYLAVLIIPSLPLVLFGLGYHALSRQLQGMRATLFASVLLAVCTPICWLAIEWVRCEGWYFQFSWAQFGFSSVACPGLRLLLPHIGVYGITFLMVLINVISTELLLAKQSWIKRGIKLAGWALVLVVMSLLLQRPLQPVIPSSGATPIRVGMVQHELGDFDVLEEQSRQLVRQGATLVVWPEYALMTDPNNPRVSRSGPKLRALLAETNISLIFGCKKLLPLNTPVDWLRREQMLRMEGDLFSNTVVLMGPDGKVIGSYDKTHPIQLFSDGVPGKRYPSFPIDNTRVGVAICYDFDYANTARRLVANGAEVLVVPTFDKNTWTDIQHNQHARMAEARAAESGRWVIRPTSSGLSQIIDPTGNTTVQIPNGNTRSIVGDVYPLQQLTWYDRYGYLLPYVCLYLFAIWAVLSLVIGFWKMLGRRKTVG